MRKWFYLVVDHPDDDTVGNVQISETHGFTTAKKNEIGTRLKANPETGESYEQKEAGLGYADFDDEDDYEERVGDVIQEKLEEIDSEYLERAGLNQEVILG